MYLPEHAPGLFLPSIVSLLPFSVACFAMYLQCVRPYFAGSRWRLSRHEWYLNTKVSILGMPWGCSGLNTWLSFLGTRDRASLWSHSWRIEKAETFLLGLGWCLTQALLQVSYVALGHVSGSSSLVFLGWKHQRQKQSSLLLGSYRQRIRALGKSRL